MDIKKYIEKLNKKVSKRKENIKDFREPHNPELINAIPVYERENAEYETIISMLEKQIPKKAECSEYDTEGDFYYLCCPVCRETIGTLNNEDDDKIYKYNMGVIYCYNCGQKIEQNYTDEDYKHWGVRIWNIVNYRGELMRAKKKTGLYQMKKANA